MDSLAPPRRAAVLQNVLPEAYFLGLAAICLISERRSVRSEADPSVSVPQLAA